MMEMRVTGLKEVIKCTTTIADSAFYRELWKWATDNAVKRAKALCPVDTGALIGSITGINDDDGGVVMAGNGCPDSRAWYNEFGSWTYPVGDGMNPVFYKGGYRPYLRPAVIDMTEDLPNELGKKIEIAYR
jgi:hypothetical protein